MEFVYVFCKDLKNDTLVTKQPFFKYLTYNVLLLIVGMFVTMFVCSDKKT